MTRKYKQPGYMEDHEQAKPRAPSRPKEIRSPLMPGVREVFRCAICGTVVPTQFGITFDSPCPKCNADLHTCKNCLYFDPRSRFECTQPIPERIPRKDVRNQCEYFEARKVVERETTTAASKIEDPRAAFDRLFRK